MTAPASPGGSRAFGRYELIAEIAKGQLGPLWVAHAGAELVAIRRVRSGPPITREQVDQLSEAAWWALEVPHDQIASAMDVVMADGELALVYRYVPGEPLRSVLRLSSFRRKPLAVGVALRIGRDLLSGLSGAYEQAAPMSRGSSLASGSLSPDSVLVSSEGSSLLLDIGVAAVAASLPAVSHHPEVAAYSAPESLEGAPADALTDVFVFGILLWEMMSGKRLFVGSSYAAVSEKLKITAIPRLDASKPVGADEIPVAVADIVARALERERSLRFQSIPELCEAIDNLGPEALAPREQVARVLEDLAGNTLGTKPQ